MKNKLGLAFFPAFDWAISQTHPEREERLLYTQDQLFEEGIDDLEDIKLIKPEILNLKDIYRTHFIIDDVVSDSHLVAAGGAYQVYKQFMQKEIDKGFALVRPPGHHANKVVFGNRGFCVVNVNAVAIEKIRAEFGPLKVAIIDTDAHHADGTQDIYYNDKDTMLISIHQDGRTLYPGSGFIDEMGGPSAYGYNINVPLPPNTADEGFLYVLDNLILPILEDFKPDIVINSAGQDNHYSDPLTNMNFSAQGYAKLNSKLNPDLAILEGGYSILTALPYINLGIVLAMAKEDYSNIVEPDFSPDKIKQSKEISTYIEEICRVILDNYNNRKALQKSKYANQQEVTIKRDIYYDTSNILEKQKRTYCLCDKCVGYEFIESTSDLNIDMFAITIPLKACSECQEKAYKRYALATADYVFLADRIKDEYLKK